MRKLRLDVDALAVESFDTDAREGRRGGTVRGREGSEFPCTFGTCYQSCGWSEIDCHTQGCRTDFDTCGQFGSCCPAICS